MVEPIHLLKRGSIMIRSKLSSIYRSLTHNRRNRDVDELMKQKSKQLSDSQVSGCRVFADRNAILDWLPQGQVGAEIGVAEGGFSTLILERAHPQKLILIDAWAMAGHPQYGEQGLVKVQTKFQREIDEGRVEIRQGWSDVVLNSLEDNSLDWIYIDAAHDYESVKKDLAVAYHKVKNDGIVLGHDYHRWGRYGQRFGVLEAVNEFCVTYNLPLCALSIENDYNWSYGLRLKK